LEKQEMQNKKLKIVILAGKGFSTNVMYHALKDDFYITAVILEEKPSSIQLLKKRIKKLGFLKVSGQVLFILFNKILIVTSSSRKKELINQLRLNDSNIRDCDIQKVKSVNNNETIELLRQLNPDAVVVNGTRIISKKVLQSFDSTFINTHMGITPKYRGIHCGYWALAMDDKNNCGVTIHLVDKGIDTGAVLYQAAIFPTKHDSFNTYPVHQIAQAIPLMKTALKDIMENQVHIKKGVEPSGLWYHPTLWGYLRRWIFNGVK
jgi:folate-dependent phosphoribosylglycinamide formyltransferase PurN